MAKIISERALVLEKYEENGRLESFAFTPGYIHNVPDWVLDHPTYKLALEEGSIHDTDGDETVVLRGNPDYDPNHDPSVPDVYRKGEFPARFADTALVVDNTTGDQVRVPVSPTKRGGKAGLTKDDQAVVAADPVVADTANAPLVPVADTPLV